MPDHCTEITPDNIIPRNNYCFGTITSGDKLTIRIINDSGVSIYQNCNDSIPDIPNIIPNNQNATFYGDLYGSVFFKIGNGNDTILLICWDLTTDFPSAQIYNYGGRLSYTSGSNYFSCQDNVGDLGIVVYEDNSTPTHSPKNDQSTRPTTSNSFHLLEWNLEQAVVISLGILFGIVVLSGNIYYNSA